MASRTDSSSGESTTSSILAEVIPGELFIGTTQCFWRLDILKQHKIGAVVCLDTYQHAPWKHDKFREIVNDGRLLWIKAYDKPWVDLLAGMEETCAFIDDMLRELNRPTTNNASASASNPHILPQSLPQSEKDPALSSSPPRSDSATYDTSYSWRQKNEGAVLIASGRGQSRSAAIAIAYLMRKQRRPINEILADIKLNRPQVRPNRGFILQLKVWAKMGYRVWIEGDKARPKGEYRALLEKKAAQIKGNRIKLEDDEEDGPPFLEYFRVPDMPTSDQ